MLQAGEEWLLHTNNLCMHYTQHNHPPHDTAAVAAVAVAAAVGWRLVTERINWDPA